MQKKRLVKAILSNMKAVISSSSEKESVMEGLKVLEKVVRFRLFLNGLPTTGTIKDHLNILCELGQISEHFVFYQLNFNRIDNFRRYRNKVVHGDSISLNEIEFYLSSEEILNLVYLIVSDLFNSEFYLGINCSNKLFSKKNLEDLLILLNDQNLDYMIKLREDRGIDFRDIWSNSTQSGAQYRASTSSGNEGQTSFESKPYNPNFNPKSSVINEEKKRDFDIPNRIIAIPFILLLLFLAYDRFFASSEVENVNSFNQSDQNEVYSDQINRNNNDSDTYYHENKTETSTAIKSTIIKDTVYVEKPRNNSESNNFDYQPSQSNTEQPKPCEKYNTGDIKVFNNSNSIKKVMIYKLLNERFGTLGGMMEVQPPTKVRPGENCFFYGVIEGNYLIYSESESGYLSSRNVQISACQVFEMNCP
jgi:hypothetical protein